MSITDELRAWVESTFEQPIKGPLAEIYGIADRIDAAFVHASDYVAPDTQEKIYMDAGKHHTEYWGCAGIRSCHNCPAKIDGKRPHEYYQVNSFCNKAQTLDLLARQWKLDGVK